MLLLNQSEKFGLNWLELENANEETIDNFITELFRQMEGYAKEGFKFLKDKWDNEKIEFRDPFVFVNFLEDVEQIKHKTLYPMFHHNPEKYVFGAYVKVGYFENDADLIYQDEFHGSLITMPDEIIDTIYRKYFKGIISYEGLQRIEDFPVPRPALREAILNAIVHRDYTTGVPIQIKIFPDCVIVYNDGRLPENWTVADLLKRHRSRPYNPKIAYTFYRSGYIETWGRGIEKITTSCKSAGKPEPLFEATSSEVTVSFFIEKQSGNISENNIGGMKGGMESGTEGGMKEFEENTQKTHRKF